MKANKKEKKPEAGGMNLLLITKRLWNESGQRGNLLLFMVLRVLMVATTMWIGIAGGTVTQNAVDFNQQALVSSLVILAIAVVTDGLLMASGLYYGVVVRERIAVRFRTMIGNQVAGADFTWTQSQKTGDILGRIQDDMRSAILYVSDGIPQLVHLAVRILFTVGYLIFIDWRLALVFFGPQLILLPLQLVMSKPVQPLFFKSMQADGAVNAQVQDIINNRTTIKAYQLEETASGWLREKMETRYKVFFKAIAVLGGLVVPTSLLAVLPLVLLGITGAILAANHTMDVGQFAAVMFVAWPLGMELSFMTERLGNIRMWAVAGERIFPMWDAPQEGLSVASVAPASYGAVLCFDDVKFAYQEDTDSKTTVLDGFCLELQPGETVALAGPSGCGKSTVLKLASALYRPEAGRIIAWGSAYEEWEINQLRARMAVVSQDTFLFPTTIRENLLYGTPEDVNEEQLVQACKDAELYDFIQNLPDGFETMVGERGIKLSGGQRQRLAIARALLRDAHLLLLDEATSSLDVVTEKEVQRTLDKLMENRAALVVAHRLSTIRNADRILVMNDGKIVEQGKHDDLLARNGFYTKLYFSQSEEAM